MTIPSNYAPGMDIRQTEVAIKQVKDHFQRALARGLNLTRVSAPLFVRPESGLNDDLNGVERPVRFDMKSLHGGEVEVVHSLAKWKRMSLKRYGFRPGEGIYTDMNAIRRDEDVDNLHSVYVDQWDWEKVITPGMRGVETLQDTVRTVYACIRDTEQYICGLYPHLKQVLPEEIYFLTAQELLDLYPDKTAKEREYAVTKEHGAVFLMGIGGKLSNGEPHDGRAPDYDDWSLNGDILVYAPVIDTVIELSSMGIRVDAGTLERQLKIAGCEERAKREFHASLLAGELPQTIGGGIGQSRLCMMLLHRAHIGEVQASVWPQSELDRLKDYHIELL